MRFYLFGHTVTHPMSFIWNTNFIFFLFAQSCCFKTDYSNIRVTIFSVLNLLSVLEDVLLSSTPFIKKSSFFQFLPCFTSIILFFKSESDLLSLRSLPYLSNAHLLHRVFTSGCHIVSFRLPPIFFLFDQKKSVALALEYAGCFFSVF